MFGIELYFLITFVLYNTIIIQFTLTISVVHVVNNHCHLKKYNIMYIHINLTNMK